MTSSETNLDRADEEAARWAVAVRKGPLQPADQRALADWLARDEENQQRLEGYQRLYVRIGGTIPGLVTAGRIPDVPVTPVRAPIIPFRRLVSGLAAAAALTLAGIWWYNRPETLATTIAQRHTVALADGTQVDLNARTSLSVRLRSGERHVRMDKGEAFFSVAKDAARPFFVATPLGTVRVTGTAFNVRTNTSGQLEVTVLEGSVSVAAPDGSFTENLRVQDQLVYDGTRSETRHLTEPSARDTAAWRDGRIVFEGETLARAVERFALYHGRNIQVTPAVAGLILGGRFRLDDLEQFFTDLQISLPVQVIRMPDGIVKLVGR